MAAAHRAHETKPRRGYYLLNVDGGMISSGRRIRGEEPGLAAIGALLRDRDLRVVDLISKAIGRKTNDVAEYRALIAGLELAFGHGVTRLRVYSDSELVVNQVNSDAQVRESDLKVLHRKAVKLKEKFTSLRVAWIPREWNREADLLVHRALAGKKLQPDR